MSEKISLSKNDVKNSQVAKIKETLNEFKDDENRSYLKLCKENSEVNFQSKNLQIFNSSNKMGKSILYIRNNTFYSHNLNYQHKRNDSIVFLIMN